MIGRGRSLPCRFAALLCVLPVVAGCSPVATGETEQSGTAAEIGDMCAVSTVIDGDTIRCDTSDGGTERVRVVGIDAPELRHGDGSDACYGQQARTELVRLVNQQRVTIERDPSQGARDNYGRRLGFLRVDGQDVGRALLERGAARATTRWKHPRLADYRSVEDKARTDLRGLWHACRSDH